jgi:hypothetical protein
MSQYRKKPVVIEAFQLGIDYMPDWFMDAVTAHEVILHGSSSGFYHMADTNADIHTLEGRHHANYGDYIIRGVKGELYPCKPDIFDMTYDMVGRPKTNADRIRAMSDEELAEFLDTCEARGYQDSSIARDSSGHLIAMLEWLQQPAEEVHHE